MIIGTLAFLLGIVLLQQLAALPPISVLLTIVPVIALAWRYRYSRGLAFFLFGLVWAGLHGHWALTTRLPAALDGEVVTLTGTVRSLVSLQGGSARFEFGVDTLTTAAGQSHPWRGRVRLAWYDTAPDTLVPGSRWRLPAKLKQPRGFANPGGFDYEQWLFTRGIDATGYVRGVSVALLEDGANAWLGAVDRYRTQLRDWIAVDGTETPSSRAVLVALGVGDRSRMGDDVWRLFLDTGTNHLVAISGLHIGYAATLGYLFGAILWWLTPLRSRVARQLVGGIGALVLGCAYAAMAGFALPTVRALVMLLLVSIALVSGRAIAWQRTLLLTLWIVLLADPRAVLGAGFWLSFGAVAALIFLFAGRGWASGDRWRRWVWVQVWLLLALAPLLFALFGRVVLLAPLANLVAIPWLSLSVVPPLLAALLLKPLLPASAAWLLDLARRALELIWPLLDWLSRIEWSLWWRPELPLWVILSGVLGFVWLTMPRGLPMRWPALIALAPMLLWQPTKPQQGEMRLHVLDVGQGLAVLVETRAHALLFDTGPRFRSGFDAGEAVVLPFLRARGIDRLDLAVISHADSDHAGGWGSVRQQMPVVDALSGEPEIIPHTRVCRVGQQWTFDGVQIEMLHPTQPQPGNSGSCVMRVAAGGWSALLTADIGRNEERVLLAAQPGRLSADVLLVPHHGSKSSSSAAFVRAVAPSVAIYAAAYRNRYGHPHAGVVGNYAAIGARQLGTALSGQVTLQWAADNRLSIISFRESEARYWHWQPEAGSPLN